MITANFFATLDQWYGLQTGGSVLGSVDASMLSLALPSCLDVLKCDWMTDITSAVPGLSLLIRLFSY